MPKERLTRSNKICELIGPSAELPTSCIATVRNVIAKINLEKEKSELPNNFFNTQEAISNVIEQLKHFHHKVNLDLVFVRDFSIYVKIDRYLKTYSDIKRKQSNAMKKAKFLNELDSILDIIKCKCHIKPCKDVDCNGCHT